MPQREKSPHRPKENWSNTHLGAIEHSALEYGQPEQGQALEPAVRSLIEPQFGHDFAKICIFAGDKAARAADALQARAFNVGNDLVFNQGEYRPETNEGKMVLAHELAHAVQHDRLPAPSSKLAPRSSPNDAAESEAHAAAASVVAGTKAQILTPPTAMFSLLPQNDSSLSQGGNVDALPALDHTIGTISSSGTVSPGAASTSGGSQAAGQTFKLSLGKNTYNLDAQAAAAKLKSYREMLKSNVVDDKRIHREVRDHREAHSIVGFWSDTLGGADLPNIERWDSIEENLFAAKLAIEHAPLDELHIRQAEMWMRLAEMTTDSLIHEIGVYSKDTVKGAERAVTGLEVVRDTSKMAVDVMSGGKLGAVYGGVQQVAQQSSEVAYGQRDSVDFKGIAVSTAADYLTGKITGKLGAGNAVGKAFGNSGVKSIAGKVVGEVVDQKIGAAVGIGTNAAVANIAGLENAPSLEETGANIWHSATEFNPGEMAKSYAMGKVMKGAVESHNSAQTAKTQPAIPHPVTEQANVTSVPEKPILENAQQPAQTTATPKAASQLPPEQLQMLLVSIQAASQHAKQASAKLETRATKPARSEATAEAASPDSSHKATIETASSSSTPEATGGKPHENSAASAARDQPASNTLPAAGSEQKLLPAPKPRGRPVEPTTDPLTKEPVGKFVVDPLGNTLIEPEGGSQVGNPLGTFVETRYPNGSPYQQLHGAHKNVPDPHSHGFLPGAGQNERGPSLDVHGNVVPEDSRAAHWEVNRRAPPENQASKRGPIPPNNSSGGQTPGSSTPKTSTQPSNKPLPTRHPFDDETTVVTGRNDEGTRKYTPNEMQRMRILDRKLGIQAAAIEVRTKFGDKLDNFRRLPKAERHAIVEFASEALHRHFTAGHEFGERSAAPDVVFKRGANVSWLGQARVENNTIDLNNETPYNRGLTGTSDEGLAGTLGHEYGHMNQSRQAQDPQGFIEPNYGQQAAREKQNVLQPGSTDEEFQRYHDQPLERDARRWGREFNEALERNRPNPEDAMKTHEFESFDGPTQKIPVVTASDLDGKGQASVKREPPDETSNLSHEDLFGDLPAPEHPGASPLEPLDFANPHSGEPLSPQIPEGSGTSLAPGRAEQLEQTEPTANTAPATNAAPAINAASATDAAPSAASPRKRMSAEGQSLYKSFREGGMNDAEARKLVQELEETAAAMPDPSMTNTKRPLSIPSFNPDSLLERRRGKLR